MYVYVYIGGSRSSGRRGAGGRRAPELAADPT